MESLIGASIDKARYSKSQWKEVTQKLKKGETKQVIDVALIEVQGRRGRKSTYVLLEEMLSAEHVSVLTDELQKLLQERKQFEDTDSILAYIFAAPVGLDLQSRPNEYRHLQCPFFRTASPHTQFRRIANPAERRTFPADYGNFI